MELGEVLDVTTRDEWRDWLARNHDKKKEIWLVYHRKASGKPRISYNEAVEEALCFGWIDSQVKNVDKDSFAQRFTPRVPGRAISEMNKERIRRLMAEGRMTSAGMTAAGDVESRLEIAPDILAELQNDPQTWANFEAFPECYKIIRIAFIEGAKASGRIQTPLEPLSGDDGQREDVRDGEMSGVVSRRSSSSRGRRPRGCPSQ